MEVPKRLRPTLPTVRHLFAHSGNECAFTGCEHPLIDRYGNFVAEVCHIEAAELGGQRFNPEMTNEQRRDTTNLMLMCHRHHVETDDVERFPVPEMQRIKAAHEARFADHVPDASDERFAEAVKEIAESAIVDRTKRQVLSLPSTMARWRQVVHGKVAIPAADMRATIDTLTSHLDALRKLPVDTRGVFLVIVDRSDDDGPAASVPASEVEQVTGADFETLRVHVSMLQRYRLVYVSEDFDGTELFGTNDFDGWPFWQELKQFCARTGEPLASFVIDFRFDLLD